MVQWISINRAVCLEIFITLETLLTSYLPYKSIKKFLSFFIFSNTMDTELLSNKYLYFLLFLSSEMLKKDNRIIFKQNFIFFICQKKKHGRKIPKTKKNRNRKIEILIKRSKEINNIHISCTAFIWIFSILLPMIPPDASHTTCLVCIFYHFVRDN